MSGYVDSVDASIEFYGARCGWQYMTDVGAAGFGVRRRISRLTIPAVAAIQQTWGPKGAITKIREQVKAALTRAQPKLEKASDSVTISIEIAATLGADVARFVIPPWWYEQYHKHRALEDEVANALAYGLSTPGDWVSSPIGYYVSDTTARRVWLAILKLATSADVLLTLDAVVTDVDYEAVTEAAYDNAVKETKKDVEEAIGWAAEKAGETLGWAAEQAGKAAKRLAEGFGLDKILIVAGIGYVAIETGALK